METKQNQNYVFEKDRRDAEAKRAAAEAEGRANGLDHRDAEARKFASEGYAQGLPASQHQQPEGGAKAAAPNPAYIPPPGDDHVAAAAEPTEEHASELRGEHLAIEEWSKCLHFIAEDDTLDVNLYHQHFLNGLSPEAALEAGPEAKAQIEKGVNEAIATRNGEALGVPPMQASVAAQKAAAPVVPIPPQNAMPQTVAHHDAPNGNLDVAALNETLGAQHDAAHNQAVATAQAAATTGRPPTGRPAAKSKRAESPAPAAERSKR